jgi:hypothetical protein
MFSPESKQEEPKFPYVFLNLLNPVILFFLRFMSSAHIFHVLYNPSAPDSSLNSLGAALAVIVYLARN